MPSINVGGRFPSVQLAEVEGDALTIVDLDLLLRGRRVVVVGLPGAFTPVCTGVHLPELVASADKLKVSGIKEIVCVAPTNPWAVQAWAKEIDPQRRLRFLSDGNLDLARGAGLTSLEPRLFLGECCKRFTAMLFDTVIKKLNVEPRIDMVSCTSAKHLLD